MWFIHASIVKLEGFFCQLHNKEFYYFEPIVKLIPHIAIIFESI